MVNEGSTGSQQGFDEKANKDALLNSANEFRDKTMEAWNTFCKEYKIGEEDKAKLLQITRNEVENAIFELITEYNKKGSLTQPEVENILTKALENIKDKAAKELGESYKKRDERFWTRLSLISAAIFTACMFGTLAVLAPGSIIAAPSISFFATASSTLLGPLAGYGTAVAAGVTTIGAFIATIFSGIKHALVGRELTELSQLARGQIEDTFDRFLQKEKTPEQKTPVGEQVVAGRSV